MPSLQLSETILTLDLGVKSRSRSSTSLIFNIILYQILVLNQAIIFSVAATSYLCMTVLHSNLLLLHRKSTRLSSFSSLDVGILHFPWEAKSFFNRHHQFRLTATTNRTPQLEITITNFTLVPSDIGSMIRNLSFRSFITFNKIIVLIFKWH